MWLLLRGSWSLLSFTRKCKPLRSGQAAHVSQQSNQLSQEHRLLRFINPACSGRPTLVRGLEIFDATFSASITPGSLQMKFYERRQYWWTRFWTFGACRRILFHSPGSSHKGGCLDEVKRMMKGDVCIGRGSRQRGLLRCRFCNTFKVVVNCRTRAIQKVGRTLENRSSSV